MKMAQGVKMKRESIKKTQAEGNLERNNLPTQTGTSEASFSNCIQEMEGRAPGIEDTLADTMRVSHLLRVSTRHFLMYCFPDLFLGIPVVCIFFLARLLREFRSCRSFLVVFLGLLPYTSENEDALTFSLPVCIPLVSCNRLIVLAKTSSLILTRFGGSGQPCLVLDLRGNALSFPPFRLLLAGGLL